jgi:hypothetical protein
MRSATKTNGRLYTYIESNVMNEAWYDPNVDVMRCDETNDEQ